MTWYPGEEGADALADMLVGAGRAVGAAARDVPGPGRGRAGRAGCRGRPVSRRRGQGRLRGGRPRRLPLLRDDPPGAALPVRLRALLRRHRLRRRAGRRGRGDASTLVNNGSRRGTEVVQVYVRAPESLVRRPDRELVGFAKVARRRRRPRRRSGWRWAPPPSATGTSTRTRGAPTRVATRCWSARRRATSGRAPRSRGASTSA